MKEDVIEKEGYPKKVKISAITGDNKFTLFISYLRFICFEGTIEDIKKVIFLFN